MINKKSTVHKLIALAVLAVTFTVLLLLSNNSAVCEFFAATFSRAWIFVFGHIFSLLPFSGYELLLIAAILGAIAFIVFVIIFLCKRKWQKLLSLVLAVFIAGLAFANIYTLSASFSYGRAPLPKEIYTEYAAEDFSKEEAYVLAERMVEKANAAYRATKHNSQGLIEYPFGDNFGELSDLLSKEFERLDNPYFSSYTPKAKKIINKTIMSELHITGVFFAPFGEANVNGYEVNYNLPHTMAHEMSHGKGIMRENEANLIASYILLTCNNPYLSYGTSVDYMYSAISLLDMYPDVSDKVSQLYSKIDVGIRQELRAYSDFWSQFNTLRKIGNFFNDLYLKLQKQPDGTGSYVEPPVIEDTGNKDTFDEPIYNIIHFSDKQNLMIKLFKEGRL